MMFLIVGTVGVKADGMMIPRPNYYIQETDQKAVIWHDGKTETLIVSVNFSGNAADFAWVIPVPGKPEVSEGADELFTGLNQLTAPKVTSSGYKGVGMFGVSTLSVNMPQVSVIETKKVDIYDVAVLTAENSTALQEWLESHGYEYPENRAYLLNSYINKGWYFVAAKVSTEALGYAGSQLKTGHATPLKLVFAAEKIVYPLKISGKPANTVPTPTQMAGGVIGAWSFETGTQGWSRGTAVEIKNPKFGKYVLKSTPLNYGSVGNNIDYYSSVSSSISLQGLISGREYIFSGYVKPAVAGQGWASLQVSGGSERTAESKGVRLNTPNWQRLEVKFTAAGSYTMLIAAVTQIDKSTEIYWDGLQLEEGVKATEFSKEVEYVSVTKISPTPIPDKYINLLLYVFADHKKEAPGWGISYAGKVDGKTIGKLAADEQGDPWMKTGKKMYLTKLTRNMRQSEMTADVYLRDAADNNSVGTGGGSGRVGWRVGLVLGLPLVVELLVIGYMWRRRKQKI